MNKMITTIKLKKETKQRLEKLKEYKRESFNDLIKKILYILNLARVEPEKSRVLLQKIDENRKRTTYQTRNNKPKSSSKSQPSSQHPSQAQEPHL
jgi:hypothetical protein